jgi:hypothetical protein
MGIEVARAISPDSPQVAVFDTAFYQTIPMKSYLVTDRKLLFFLPLIAGRQARIIILEILQCMDACPAVIKRDG